jgi:hypothetical protein
LNLVAKRATTGRKRDGVGVWLVFVIVLILCLVVMGGASHFQNQELNRNIVDAYLGRMAEQIALSAVEEAFYKLHHHLLDPETDAAVKTNWDSFLVSIPDNSLPTEIIEPEITRAEFKTGPKRPKDYDVEKIEPVEMQLVHTECDYGKGFTSGALEFRTSVRVRIGAFPVGIAVTRRVKVRKRFYAAESSETQSPVLRFMSEDISREVWRQ